MTDSFDPAHELVHRSPPLGLLASVFVALFAASVVAPFLMTGGAAYPIPYKPIDQLQDYYTRFSDAMRVVAFLQFGATRSETESPSTIVPRTRMAG